MRTTVVASTHGSKEAQTKKNEAEFPQFHPTVAELKKRLDTTPGIGQIWKRYVVTEKKILHKSDRVTYINHLSTPIQAAKQQAFPVLFKEVRKPTFQMHESF